MQCLNCGKEVASNARSCKFCKADLEVLPDISPDEMLQMLKDAGLDEVAQEQLRKLAEETDSPDEFANALMLGDCPKCGSKKVEDCGEVEGVEDLTVGQCLDCGLRWCSECGYHLKKDELECPHWRVCKVCPDEEDCPHILDATECKKVVKWMKSAGVARREA